MNIAMGTRDWVKGKSDDEIKSALRYILHRALDPDSTKMPIYIEADENIQMTRSYRWGSALTGDFVNILWAHGVFVGSSNSLTPRQADACIYHFGKHLTYDEVGERLLCKERTVASEIGIALQKMVELIRREVA